MAKIVEVGRDRLAVIVEINRGIFRQLYPWEPFSLEQYEEKIGDDPHILIATYRNRVVGNSIGFKREGSWYIWILGVIPEFRRKGIGSALLGSQEVYGHLSGNPTATIKVYNCTPDMQRLVIGRGYQAKAVEQVGFLDRTYNAVRFEKQLYMAVRRKPGSRK